MKPEQHSRNPGDETSGASPFFSVVVPVLNRVDLLPATLESALAQEYSDFEIVVVDNNSDDGTPEMVAERYGDRVRLLKCENRGLGPPRNVGISAASGRYVAFLDSDDLWFPWTLAAYAEAIEDSDSPAFLVAQERRFADDAELDLTAEPHGEFTARRYPDFLAAADDLPFVVSCSAAVVRADALREADGFFEEPYNSEDSDLWLKLGTAPGFVWLTGAPLWAYRVRPGNTAQQTLPAYRGRLHMIDAERAGRYPGGPARRRERRAILTRHARPVSLALLAEGRRAEAWMLYRRTFAWNLALGRFKYLSGFPLRALTAPSKGN